MRNPRRMMAQSILGLEALVLALMTPVLVSVEHLSVGASVAIGIGSAAVALVLCGLLRAEWAYWSGFGLQVFALAMGLIVPAMLALGVVFGALWTTAYLLGRRIEAEQRRPAAPH